MHPNARRSGLDTFENHKIGSVIFLVYRHRKLLSLLSHLYKLISAMWVPSFCVLTRAQIRSDLFLVSHFRLQTEPWARRSKTFIENGILDSSTYRHINASACWRWICVRCVANCEKWETIEWMKCTSPCNARNTYLLMVGQRLFHYHHSNALLHGIFLRFGD